MNERELHETIKRIEDKLDKMSLKVSLIDDQVSRWKRRDSLAAKLLGTLLVSLVSTLAVYYASMGH